jgi:hypothetical protein
MSLVGDIATAYRDPVAVVARQDSQGLREPQTLFYGMLFGFLSFLAQLPVLSVLAERDGPPLFALAAANLVAFLFFLPLMLYMLAGLSHAILVRFGGSASWAQSRRALFWSALVSAPLILLSGLAAPVLPRPFVVAAQLLTGAVFFWQWIACQTYFEFRTERA